jgi:exopolysaccharide biosynthesis polyprenyl glycosylphosphotransferase
LIGFIDDQKEARDSAPTDASLPVLGPIEESIEIIRRNGVEEVIVATTALHRDQLLPLFEHLALIKGVQVRLSSGLYEIMTTGVQVHPLGSVPLMSLNSLRLDPIETLMKTVLDYGVILGLAIFWLPIFGVLSLAVKFDSPGPAIYRRRVLGVGGKQFDAFKFRTMVTNGDEILAQYPELQAELEISHKLRDDPRVTRVGKWLRKTSLDELPQLLNVLLGQMSLVGPRMIHPSEAKEFGKHSLNLLTVKPGLTGLWQVSGRSDLSYDDRIRLDMHYIRNYSIWLDLQILFFQTIPAVIGRRGAY